MTPTENLNFVSCPNRPNKRDDCLLASIVWLNVRFLLKTPFRQPNTHTPTHISTNSRIENHVCILCIILCLIYHCFQLRIHDYATLYQSRTSASHRRHTLNQRIDGTRSHARKNGIWKITNVFVTPSNTHIEEIDMNKRKIWTFVNGEKGKQKSVTNKTETKFKNN